MSDEGKERSVEDVLAAIRARVAAEGASLEREAPDEEPLVLTATMQVEDADEVAPLVLDRPVVDEAPAEEPLRLDTPVADEAPLRLDTPVEEESKRSSPEGYALFAWERGPESETASEDEAPEPEEPSEPSLPAGSESPIALDSSVAANVEEEAVPDAPYAEVPEPEAEPAEVTALHPAADDETTTDEPASEDDEPAASNDTAEEDTTPPAEYDVWSARPAEGESVFTPATEPSAAVAAAATVASAAALPDRETIRGMVREAMGEQGHASSNEPDLRALVREILIEELQGEMGAQFSRGVRKAVRKDIIRAFKERGLN
ncbi:hypothetical protein [Pontivivens ytuae]|uniref:Uncharacterized protein n=1 Tax=Pontivivens ytuae TaxID=2789856 RepID=A0A7S9LRP9_9RHOB|nr:hypothetical protein [Pontivivens ytuae]QPH54069.1 hypothetical protein I0K15_20235 [Pontivivens ytuae]